MANFPIKGVDISNHNGNVNFSDLKTGGVQYVYIKATEGATFKDAYTSTNYNGAKAKGLKVGFYHFLSKSSAPEAQAENAYNYTKGFTHDLTFMLDVETDFNGMSDYTCRFIKRWKELTNVEIGIYTYSGFLGNFTQSAIAQIKDLKCWIANYRSDYGGVKTGFFNNIVGWQYSDKGVYGSYKGDVNVFNTSVLCNNVNPNANDEIIKDTKVYDDGDLTQVIGSLSAGDKVEVLATWSEASRIAWNGAYAYIWNDALKSHSYNDEVIKDAEVYEDGNGENAIGKVKAGDKVYAITYWSTLTKIKWDTIEYAYVPTTALKSHAVEDGTPVEDEKAKEKAKLEAEIKAKDEEIAGKQRDIENVNAEIKSLQEKVETLSGELADLKAEKATLEEKLKALEE